MFLEPPNETQLDFIKNEECYQPPEKLEQDITQLIQWLSKQPHLPNITDRKWLLHFIIGCKYNLQKSKQVIESYFVSRVEFPELFGTITKESATLTYKYGGFSYFPKRTLKGERIQCIRSVQSPDTSDNDYDAVRFCKYWMTSLDLLLDEEPMYGNITIFDMTDMSLSKFLTFTPTLTKKMVTCCLNAFPFRLKALHFIHPPTFISRIVMFLKMLLPNKIKDRIIVNETLEDLYNYIPKDILPEEYGGTCGNIDQMEAEFFDFLLANQEKIVTRPTADLSKRPKTSKSNELDMAGTFKTLEID